MANSFVGHLSTSPFTASHCTVRDISVLLSEIYCTYVPRHRLNTYTAALGLLPIAGPSAWNSLPDPVRNPNSTEAAFRRLLKAFFSHGTSTPAASGSPVMRHTNRHIDIIYCAVAIVYCIIIIICICATLVVNKDEYNNNHILERFWTQGDTLFGYFCAYRWRLFAGQMWQPLQSVSKRA